MALPQMVKSGGEDYQRQKSSLSITVGKNVLLSADIE
jgi:hypothetical protein